MAQWALQALNLQELWLIPAGQPPHKADRPVTAAQHRLKMTELAVQDNPHIKVCKYEIEKPSASYTIETLIALRPQFEQPPILIVGLDSLLNLHHWHRWQEFGDYCDLAVLPRQDAAVRDAASLQTYCEHHLPSYQGKVIWLDLPPVDISSTLLRGLLSAGYDCRYALVPAVWKYIQEQGLYR